MAIDPPPGLEQGDLELLLRIAGWRRRVRPDEEPGAARLVAAGLLVVELRREGPIAEATKTGVTVVLDGRRIGFRDTIGAFFSSSKTSSRTVGDGDE